MANRSYLYATDIVPTVGRDWTGGRMVGISEWNYDVPIAFRLLLTADPRTAASSIFDFPEPASIVGEYAGGVSRLLRELDQIADPEVVPLRDETRQFLSHPANQRKFFLLECGEIFEIDTVPLGERNAKLLSEIKDLSVSAAVPWPRKKTGLISKLLLRRSPEIDWNAAGLGNWTNVLFYPPIESDSASPAE